MIAFIFYMLLYIYKLGNFMKKKNFIFPLSLDDIAKLIGKEYGKTSEIEGVVMVNKNHTNSQIRESIKEQIFKNVFDQWKFGRSVVVGEDKLLTTVDLQNFEIKDQASSVKSIIVMQVKQVKATILIEQDPEHAQEIKEDKKNKLKM